MKIHNITTIAGAGLITIGGLTLATTTAGANTAPATPPAVTPIESVIASQTLAYTNRDRALRPGTPQLQESPYLTQMAQAWVDTDVTPEATGGLRDPTGKWASAYEIAHPCSGVCPYVKVEGLTGHQYDAKNGSSASCGPKCFGSGIAVAGWGTSPPHWNNIMATTWDMAGVGVNCATGHVDILTGTTSHTFANWPVITPKPNPITAATGTTCFSRTPDPTTGYRMVAGDGGVFDFGNAQFQGSMGGKPLNQPVVASAATPTGKGYWEVAGDGGIFSFGNAQFHGSMGGKHLNKPVVGMAADPATGGYWEVASDGGIFSFDAPFYGSMGGKPLNKPIVGMAATPTGGGYWLVASDGGIFSFGNAQFHGSMGGKPLNEPIVGMATDASTGGYWEVSSTGGIFTFETPFHGSATGHASSQVVGIAPAPTGGYWIADATGQVFAEGVSSDGTMTGKSLNEPMVGFAIS